MNRIANPIHNPPHIGTREKANMTLNTGYLLMAYIPALHYIQVTCNQSELVMHSPEYQDLKFWKLL